MKQPWARWVLVVCNGLAAGVTGILGILAWSAGTEHHVGSLLFTEILIFGIAAVFGTLARKQLERRGRILQTIIAGLAILLASASFSIYPAIYGVFALLSVWWLGDFLATDEPAPLSGTPDTVARVMWRRGDSDELIRNALVARNVPPDEIEKLIYELASSEKSREQVSQT